MLRRVAGEAIEFEIAAAPELWPALADPAQIEAALVNLIMNARDAMPRGGRLGIRTGNAEVAPGDALAEASLAPGSYVWVSVADTGNGIPPENRDRVFEPFFTTKGSGQGTGLGLSIIYGFAKQSGGHIEVESEPGKGSNFRIYLSRAAAAVAPMAERTDGAGQLPRGRASETILVVEDNEQVRSFAATTLNELGYTVLQANDARQALVGRNGRIDLLFSDVVLGNGMNGFELAAAARAQAPNLPVLFTRPITNPRHARPAPTTCCRSPIGSTSSPPPCAARSDKPSAAPSSRRQRRPSLPIREECEWAPSLPLRGREKQVARFLLISPSGREGAQATPLGVAWEVRAAVGAN